MTPETPTLWAMTTYFNPAGFRRRREMYDVFRRHLRVPLLAVEASHDGRFALGPGDADLLVQVPCPDVLWLKARLLNVGLGALPASCEYVAWLDCDVVFARDDWALAAVDALRDAELVHLAEVVTHVGPDADPERLAQAPALVRMHSIVAAWRRGQTHPGVLAEHTFSAGPGLCTGYAWAARRALLTAHGFYDACIVGGGDKALFAAAMGHAEQIVRYHGMNVAMQAHYRAWSERLAERVGGRVTWLPGDVYHLWHGDLQRRRYAARHAALADAGFDPFTDVRVDAAGALRWATDEPALRARVRDYFADRREDG